jgi:hypothetical protein
LLGTVLLRDFKSLLHFPFMNNFRNEQIATGCSTTVESDIDSWLAHIIYNLGLTWLPQLCSHSNSSLLTAGIKAAADCCGETNFALLHMMERRYSNRK